MLSSISIAEREEGTGAIADVIRCEGALRTPIWHSGAEKKVRLATRNGNFSEKRGSGIPRIDQYPASEAFGGISHNVSYLEALAAIAVSLAILMAIAWMVQRRTGNSGWVDTIRTFAVGFIGARSALWPIGGAAPNRGRWLIASLVAIWPLRLGLNIAGVAPVFRTTRSMPPSPENGASMPRKMFIFLENQAFGSVPLRVSAAQPDREHQPRAGSPA